jgi:hypothetical protein
MMRQQLLWLIGATTLRALPSAPQLEQYPAPLTFRDDGTFKISVFEDLHFGEDEFTRKSRSFPA